VCAHIDDEETESFLGRINGKTVHFDKCEIRVRCGGVGGVGVGVNR
jgi:hypothetical protein